MKPVTLIVIILLGLIAITSSLKTRMNKEKELKVKKVLSSISKISVSKTSTISNIHKENITELSKEQTQNTLDRQNKRKKKRMSSTSTSSNTSQLHTVSNLTKSGRAILDARSLSSKSLMRKNARVFKEHPEQEASFHAEIAGSVTFSRIVVFEGDMTNLLKKIGVFKEGKYYHLNNDMILKAIRPWLSSKCKLECLREIKAEFDTSVLEGFRTLQKQGEFKYEEGSNTFSYKLKEECMSNAEVSAGDDDGSRTRNFPSTGPFGYYGGRGKFPDDNEAGSTPNVIAVPGHPDSNDNNTNGNDNGNTANEIAPDGLPPAQETEASVEKQQGQAGIPSWSEDNQQNHQDTNYGADSQGGADTNNIANKKKKAKKK